MTKNSCCGKDIFNSLRHKCTHANIRIFNNNNQNQMTINSIAIHFQGACANQARIQDVQL